MTRQLISAQSVIEAAKNGQKTIAAEFNSIITPSAKDMASSMGIRIVSKDQSTPQSSVPKRAKPLEEKETLAIGCDHGGFRLKQVLIPYIENLGHRVVDVGTFTEEPCDYPDFAYMVARMVSLGEASKGIVIDGIGTASAIVANKVPGIRAACCNSEFVAKSSREHNDANILTFGGRVLGAEAAESIVGVWLGTWFGGGRHKSRVDKITEIEKRHSK